MSAFLLHIISGRRFLEIPFIKTREKVINLMNLVEQIFNIKKGCLGHGTKNGVKGKKNKTGTNSAYHNKKIIFRDVLMNE
jgi:hypothetical protein